MQYSSKKTLSLLTGICLVAGLTSACQPNSETSTDTVDVSELTETTMSTNFDTEHMPVSDSTKANIDSQLTDSGDNEHLDNEHVDLEQDCANATIASDVSIQTAMSQVDNTSKIEDIEVIDEQLKTCLPHTDSAIVLDLLHQYSDMYNRFLTVNYEEWDYDYYDVLYLVDQKEYIAPQQLDSMGSRVRYLIDLVRENTDVTLTSEGEGFYVFSHDLQAMATLFTPYLHEDQQAFIDRMAQDNQESFWNDAAINLSYRELMERAIFWEDYIKQYPEGYSIAGAKSLYYLYRYSLIFGSENSSWTEDNYHEFYDPKVAGAVKQLSQRPNSQLAEDAKRLLAFMELPDDERLRQYPVPTTDANGYEIHDYDMARYQLAQALPIIPPWEHEGYAGCLNGVFCQ